jgi:hypothetical protein
MAIACLLSSEAGIVPRHEDDTGHAIYQVTLDGLGKAAATQRWTVSFKKRRSGIESAAANPNLQTRTRRHALSVTLSLTAP